MDPAVIILGLLFVVALPVLGYFAFKLLLKKPEVIVETEVVKAAPVKTPPVEKPPADEPAAGLSGDEVAMNSAPARRQSGTSGRRNVAAGRSPGGHGG